MSEHFYSSSNPEKSEPTGGLVERYPTDEELQTFESHREYQRAMHPLDIPYTTIEKYARDPENPTEAEIKAVDELNALYSPRLTSFEEYFGYPDPRGPESEHQDDQQESDGRGV